MNAAQRKILVIACYVFAPIFLLIGLAHESAFIGVVLPIASIFAALFFKKSSDNSADNRQITYDEYVITILPLTIKYIAIGFVDAVIDDIKNNPSTNHITEDELKQFIVKNFNTEVVKNEFVEILRKNYTNEEFQYLARFALSKTGLILNEKSHVVKEDFEKLIKPEITRVSELLEEKFNLYED